MICFGLSRTFWALVTRYISPLAAYDPLGSSFAPHSRCLAGALNGNIGKGGEIPFT